MAVIDLVAPAQAGAATWWRHSVNHRAAPACAGATEERA